MRHFLLSLTFLVVLIGSAERVDAKPPNVLMIVMDDLNDWIGCMGGHPQSLTPNLDRLASQSVLFTNAHCPAPACNPCRTSVFTGRSPHRSGLYDNGQKMRDVLPDAEIMPKIFTRNGYHSAGSGKLLHYFIDANSWDDYFPEAAKEDPFPRTLYPDERPVSLPRGGPWQYVETDWAALDATDEEYGGDYLVAKWISEQLSTEREKPFFLACGFYRPHEPWFVPQKYFEPFPIDSIQLPPGYLVDDLSDLPPEGKRRGPNRYFAHIQENKQWKQGIQGYLASIHFSDAMLGKVLDALEQSGRIEDTIVVLWSDHGWHLGEKEHWQKFTLWRACTRVPLMVRVPRGVSALKRGTTPGECTQPVSLVSLFPTLLELCGLPAEKWNDGPSLVPLLRDPQSDWDHVAVTYLHDAASYSVSDNEWRYIHYGNGDKELYNVAEDRYEWKNLAETEKHRQKLQQLASQAPQALAPKPKVPIESLPKLAWEAVDEDNEVPPSKPDGGTFDIIFVNRSQQQVELFWMDREGNPKSYGLIDAGKTRSQRTRPGAVWMIRDKDGKDRGFFRVGDRASKAVVPELN